MEHLCYQCAAGVEDGTPFCKQCNAPQIRVNRESAASIPEIAETLRPLGPATTGIQWSQALPSAALAGLFAAFFMFIPLGAFGLGMMAGGVLAVRFYRRRDLLATMTPGVGARLGGLSGVLGFCFFSIFTAIEVLIFHNGGEWRTAMLEAIKQSAARTSDPQAQQMLEYLKSPPGLVLMMTFGLILVFVAFVIFSTLGGVIGAALMRRRDPR